VRFNRYGLAFDYPENWSVDTEDSGGRYAAVTVHSPEGGFWSVSGHAPGGSPAELATAVVRQMRKEYPELDSAEAEDEVAGRCLPGIDMNFYCLDLTNTAQVRTLETPGAIYLLFCQAEDREWDRVAPVFAAMTTSFVAGAARNGYEPATDEPAAAALDDAPQDGDEAARYEPETDDVDG